MALIKHNLLPKQKPRKNNLKVNVDLYPCPYTLYDELSTLGFIQRLKDIPQLGVIKVPKRLAKSRFDYTFLQLHFHQLVKKDSETKLEMTYNNEIIASEFRDDLCYKSSDDKPTIGDLLQILTIAYNLGHFYNTFTASRAVIMVANESPNFRNKLINSSNSPRFQSTMKKLLDEQNYQRLHLANSLLLLERCDQNKQSILLAQELLYAYLNESEIKESSKLHFVFNVFRSVRNVSYMAYDLQVANMPFIMDLCNDDAIFILLRELLSAYNDQLPANQLITSIGKMLDDTVYNENSNAICYYRISRKMASTFLKDNESDLKDYYSDLWWNPESIFNVRPKHSRDYSPDAILKLTFGADDRKLSQKLLTALERINNSRVGYYDRHTGEQTIVVSIRKKCLSKENTAFRILKTTVSYLHRVATPSITDTRYLLASKF